MSVNISFHGGRLRAVAMSKNGSCWLSITTIDTVWDHRDEVTFFLHADFEKMKLIADTINAIFPEPESAPDESRPINAIIGEDAIDHDDLDIDF